MADHRAVDSLGEGKADLEELAVRNTVLQPALAAGSPEEPGNQDMLRFEEGRPDLEGSLGEDPEGEHIVVAAVDKVQADVSLERFLSPMTDRSDFTSTQGTIR